MFNQNSSAPYGRPTLLLALPLLVALLLLLFYPESWLLITVGLLVVWIVAAVLAAAFDLKIKPDLKMLLDTYLKEAELDSSESFIHGKLWLGDQDHFISVRCDLEGVVLLYSGKRYGVLEWDDIWEIRGLLEQPRSIEMVLVANQGYDGVKRLTLPWKEEFWTHVPAIKVKHA